MSNEYADSFDTDEYEIREGTVIDALPGAIIVRVDKNGDECGGCGSCAMKSLCRGKDIGHLDLAVAVPGGIPSWEKPPERDDRVRIGYRPANAALAAFVMFVPALCGLLFGGIAGWFLGIGSGWPDGILVLGCGTGFALGVLLSVALSRMSPALRPKTILLRNLLHEGEGVGILD